MSVALPYMHPVRFIFRKMRTSIESNIIFVFSRTTMSRHQFQYYLVVFMFEFATRLAHYASSDVILDAIFGFSFKPPVRAPFDAALPLIANSGLPIVSVDVPSGWNVDEGKADDLALEPDVLVSLTAPKEGVRKFRGRHFLGGRFVPKCVALLRVALICLSLTPSQNLGGKV